MGKGWKKSLERQFRSSSERLVSDLSAAVANNKYWRMLPSEPDKIFVIALTRARTKRGNYSLVRVTGLGTIRVPQSHSRYIRRYRIILASRSEGLAMSVLTWNAFNELMRHHRTLIPSLVAESDRGLFDMKAIRQLLRE